MADNIMPLDPEQAAELQLKMTGSDFAFKPSSGNTPAFRRKQHLAAIEGKGIPLSIDSRLGRLSVIRGIRLHYSFATCEDVSKLCAEEAVFARARNARLIMSNIIPSKEDMSDLAVAFGPAESRLPYCIWYPTTASESTYRELARRFPCMRYHVGRACSAAGFKSLYDELDLLPDISIAEEARESDTPGGRAIYDDIMNAPARYLVMNDYTRTINVTNPTTPAFLNGDTDVRWRLTLRCSLGLDDELWYPDESLCIEEDGRLDVDENTEKTTGRNFYSYDEAQLLFRPLPNDLPTVKKDLLIHMAARQGNIDRYVRLARPLPLTKTEFQCVLYGIYHDTLFARFWKAEIGTAAQRTQRLSKDQLNGIKRAISARRIMSGDTQEFDNGWMTGEPLPFMLWWPLKPDSSVLFHLADIAPEMHHAIAIAAIILGHYELYEYLKYEPTYLIWRAAKRSPDPRILRDVEAIVAEQGIDLMAGIDPWEDDECKEFEMDIKTSHYHFEGYQGLHDGLAVDDGKSLDTPYDGIRQSATGVETLIWAPRQNLDRIFRSEQ